MLSDKDIKKVLRCCSGNGSCMDCPGDKVKCALEKYALDLIERQEVEKAELQAEIERLQTEKDNLIKTYKECATELVKEFAERYRKEIHSITHFNGYVNSDLVLSIFNNLEKEMVGEG